MFILVPHAWVTSPVSLTRPSSGLSSDLGSLVASFIQKYVLPVGTHIARSFMTELGASTLFEGVKFISIGPAGVQAARYKVTQPYWGNVSGRHLLLLLLCVCVCCLL